MDDIAVLLFENSPVFPCHGPEATYGSLEDRLRALTATIVRDAGLDPASIGWSVERTPVGLRVRAQGPPLDERTRARLAVRALDAVRERSTRSGTVDVTYATESN